MTRKIRLLTHEPHYALLGNGLLRAVCRCGWQSDIVTTIEDTGPVYKSQRAELREHRAQYAKTVRR